jgi:deoxyribodipyrimidine photo-lyase
MERTNIFWFRRDLRLEDNTALHHALQSSLPVLPIFIFDKNILDRLEDNNDRRVTFIHQSLQQLWLQLKEMGSGLQVYYGTPGEIFKKLLQEYQVEQVFANHDYEPYGKERDVQIAKQLHEKSALLKTYKDIVIFEKDEVLKDDGTPYTVFTPYSRKWKLHFHQKKIQSWNSKNEYANFLQLPAKPMPHLKEIGFNETPGIFPPPEVGGGLIKKYKEQRDFPGINGTSRLGIHLRFGTISIRKLVLQAADQNETFLNELIWREFYQAILWHFPKVGEGKSFRVSYDNIPWVNDEAMFEKWCQGNTGYPIVDAGMRELKTTGHMHNRVRMITASFLTKHLLTDWRWGEAWFARHLLDFELASNNGGWQWASSSGCDAAPYFRIFNPHLQTKKFDPDFTYIRKWVPGFEDFSYPKPVVEHEFARKRCLEVYTKTLQQTSPG